MVLVRLATPADDPAIAALTTHAFGGPQEAAIVQRLAVDGDSLASLVAEAAGAVIGHIQFFRIGIAPEAAEEAATPARMGRAAGLGPMSVRPDRQREGVGSALIQTGVAMMRDAGESWIFVLGEPGYYGRFGFDAAPAARFRSPWPGPAFMALRVGADLGPDTRESGRLVYPEAFVSPSGPPPRRR